MAHQELMEQIVAQTRKYTNYRKPLAIMNIKSVQMGEEREQLNGGAGNILAATPKGFSRRLHRKQAAEFLGVSLSWLDKARISGLGPVFVTMGGRILYDSRDLEAFIYSNRHSSTSEQY